MKRSLILSAALFGLLGVDVALAHSGEIPHAHPHGIETALGLAIAVGVVIAAVWYLRRR